MTDYLASAADFLGFPLEHPPDESLVLADVSISVADPIDYWVFTWWWESR